MDKIILYPSSTSQWHALVEEACQASKIPLDEELHSYLAFLLMRFSESPEIANSVVALDFLESCHKTGQQKQVSMQQVGDKCLLFTGLFPGRARKRRVKASYFVEIGKAAYASASDSKDEDLFNSLCDEFVNLMDVLQTMRGIDAESSNIDLIQAEELWRETGSKHAFNVLQQITNPNLIITNHDCKH